MVSEAANSTGISAKKQRANRRNARKSTGPRTLAGKARSSRNAITHGTFCEHFVLPEEDETSFGAIMHDFIERLRPQDLLELSLVERVAQGTWRLMRLDQREFAEQEAREEPDIRRKIIIETLSQIDGELGRIPRTAVREASRSLFSTDNKEIDRYGPARQRVEQSISRALRELRMLQGKNASELPASPFLDVDEGDDQCDDTENSQNPQNEPTAAESIATAESAAGCRESGERLGDRPAAEPPALEQTQSQETVGGAEPHAGST